MLQTGVRRRSSREKDLLLQLFDQCYCEDWQHRRTEACLKNLRELGVESDARYAIIDGYAHTGDVEGAESTLAKL